jgi:hypothetical protein
MNVLVYILVRFILILCLGLSISSYTIAYNLPTKLYVNVNQDTIEIGDHITYKLRLTYPKNAQVIWPEMKGQFGDFEILEKSIKIDYRGSDKIEQQLIFKMITFIPGKHKLPPLNIKVIYNNQTQLIETSSINIICNSIPVEITKPFKGIIASESIGYTHSELLPYYILSALTSSFCIGFIFFKINASDKIRRILKIPPQFYRRTASDLKKLKHSENPLEKLHHILKTYLTERFAIPADYITTRELVKQLELKDINMDSLMKVHYLFKTMDRAKFDQGSKHLLNINLLIQESKNFVSATKPRS